MARLAFMFPSARRSEPRVSVPFGTFAEAFPAPVAPTKSDVAPRGASQTVEPADCPSESSFAGVGWENDDSDVFRLTLPPEVDAPSSVFPNLEAALLAAADRHAPRRPSQPELPPLADPHRRNRV